MDLLGIAGNKQRCAETGETDWPGSDDTVCSIAAKIFTRWCQAES